MPMLVRWPGKIEAGSVANGIVQHHDWLPTFLAMAGAPDVPEQLKTGYEADGKPSRTTSTATTWCPT